ncbi:ubiquitin carboxyl-terminal hydrolase isozyme L3 isoform X2 [Takifugu flavidus]|uniref:ubiquitin carboxyl-terminal hydrolase isozyme L3 isoform X2 n=1 Tax=Takifugu flavidus TaxID=433684 RepID=UPI0025444F97|nr:ubiquitin carboxyl-terminal hydrolase isozyme L3 isoform X2 [Takifugu flavidus]
MCNVFWLMTKYVTRLGVKPSWQFVDVYGLDPELVNMVPRPVCAVLLLFPVTDTYEAFKQEEEDRIKQQPQDLSPDVYFIKQTISNACGTIGLLHAMGNNQKYLEFDPNSFLKKFFESTFKMTPGERAAFLEKDETICVMHESSAQEGQTELPGIDEKVNLHFIALVNVGGQLYELDGRKAFPIVHGKTSEDTFLEDALGVCKTFMDRDPEEVLFTIVALSKNSM